jgi:glycine dehydrogenase subunit 2
LKAFADTLNLIAEEVRTNPELVRSAPISTPIGRCNDALAARNLNLRWTE